MESARAGWLRAQGDECADGCYLHPVKRLCLRADDVSDAAGAMAELTSANLPSTPTQHAEWPPLPPLFPHSGSCDSTSSAAAQGAPALEEEQSAENPATAAAPALEAEARGNAETRADAPSLDSLGEDLLLHVLRLAQPTAWDLCRMACVSRTWRQTCYNRIFWTKLRVGSGSMRPGVEQLAARCSSLVELHIDDPRCELYVLHPIVVACGPSLRRIAINCDMDTSSRNEASICSILWIISLYCKNVDTVELLSDGKRGGFNYLESKALWYLTTGFRSIRSFASLCQESITKQSLYLMVIAWRDLACLRIHCGMLGLDDLMSLRKCHALRVLELVGGHLQAMVGEVVAEKTMSRDRVIHAKLEVVVLSDILCEPQDIVCLTQLCPGLKKVLLSKGSWAHPRLASLPMLLRQQGQFRLLQSWLAAAKGIELLIEE